MYIVSPVKQTATVSCRTTLMNMAYQRLAMKAQKAVEKLMTVISFSAMIQIFVFSVTDVSTPVLNW